MIQKLAVLAEALEKKIVEAAVLMVGIVPFLEYVRTKEVLLESVTEFLSANGFEVEWKGAASSRARAVSDDLAEPLKTPCMEDVMATIPPERAADAAQAGSSRKSRLILTKAYRLLDGDATR
jgi:hypothetical protein